VAFTSDAAWDPTTLDNVTDFTVLNKNLILSRADEYFGARLSDTGEKGTKLLRKCLWNVAMAIDS